MVSPLIGSINMKKIVYYVIFFVSIFCLAELMLYALINLFPDKFLGMQSPISQRIDDKVLGDRPNPKYHEHDKNGFRNITVPQRIDIIAMGDSQTYGTGVERDSAWPQQLQALTGLKVYNMSYGGYGPVHSLVLLNEAMKLSPKIVIEAFYAGNDLYDSFNISYYLNDFDYLKTHEREAIKRIKECETNKSLTQVVLEVYPYDRKVEPTVPGVLDKAKRFCYEHILLYKLFSLSKSRVLTPKNEQNPWLTAKNKALNYPNDTLIFESQYFRTIFTPRYRLTAVNLGDPRIQEGLNISLKAISLMKERLANQGIQFGVVLIPTKELVFSSLVNKRNITNHSAQGHYFSAIKYEQQMWEIVHRYLQTNQVLFLDILPHLQKSLKSNVQPYQQTADGHPNHFGHEVIASCIRDELLPRLTIRQSMK